LFESLSKTTIKSDRALRCAGVSKNPIGESPSDLEKVGDSAFNPDAGHPA
jgi:hypothetical protein